jgi:hypothetical protein
MELAYSNTFKTIFPKYTGLVSEQEFPSNNNIEQYLRTELPLQV